MKAIAQKKRGPEFATMELVEMQIPKPGPNEVRVTLSASRINPVDMDLMKGFPMIKYKDPQLGGVEWLWNHRRSRFGGKKL